MLDEDHCPLNPSLRKIECAHCQGPLRGTYENPRFSVEERGFGGHYVEILKNGGPVHLWDKHFDLRMPEVQIVLACANVLREFWQSTDEERLKFAERLVEERASGLRVQVYIEMRPEFTNSKGTRVDRPHLCLKALPPHQGRIGLGWIKCRAICEVQPELHAWIKKGESAQTNRLRPQPSHSTDKNQ